VAATIADVAARSGVSTATVSRILSGSAPARPETRARVLEAARELGYRPSGVARALKRRETRTLGLVVTDITNPFYPQIVRAAEIAAHERGYGLVLANGEDDAVRELQHLELLVERRVDGIVIASSHLTRHHSARLDEITVPIVLVNDPIADSSRPAITADHRLGTRLATEHLLELGHRRIGHISAPPEHVAAGLRQRGVSDAMRAVGTPLVVEGDGGVAGGAAAVPALLEAGITAVVAYNDLTAIGALGALHERGARVPHDVSLVGFDDIPMAAWTDPPLTTVRQDTEALGRWAVERIIRELAGEAAVPDHVLVEPGLVIRQSTGPRI
jgi:LacI family transcriptional regulator